MRKEQLVAELNELLGMDHRLSHWQFTQVRRYELVEMVNRVQALRAEVDNYKDKVEDYEHTYGPANGYR